MSSDSMDSSSDEEQGRNPSAPVSGRNAASAAAGKDSSSSSDSSSDSSSSDSEAEAVQPVTDARLVTLQLSKVNPSFTCKLCSGYLRDAHTLMDCLHTFCRSCLERYIVHTRRNDVVHCPYRQSAGCTTALIATHPMRTEVRYDRAMQNLVDKLLPQYVQADEEIKKQIEKQFGGGGQAAKRSQAAAQAKAQQAAQDAAGGDSSSNKRQKFGDEKFGTDKLMIFELRPYIAVGGGSGSSGSASAPLPPLPQPFVKTSSKVTVKHLRKFVAERLGLGAAGASASAGTANSSAAAQAAAAAAAGGSGGVGLDLMCSGEVLGQDHSIEFVWRTRWNHLHPNQHMVLTYRQAQLF